MELVWQKNACEDYIYWQQIDAKMLLLRINELIKDCIRSPFKCIGKPEPLKGNYAGCWSRRINNEHRLVYKYLRSDCIFYNATFIITKSR